MRSSRAAFIQACVVGFLISTMCGCQKPPDFAIHLVAPGMDANTKLKLNVDGVETAPISLDGDYNFTAHGHRAKKPQDMLPHIEASVFYVCGWQTVNVDLPAPSEDDIQQARDQKQSVSQPMYLDFNAAPLNVTVYVDNHGGPATLLAVGESEQPVAANYAGQMTFPYWPHCDEAKQLFLNGEAIGNLQEDPRSPGSPLDVLLDTSGKRCFRLEWHIYSNEPDVMVPEQLGGQKTLKPQRLHTLSDEVNYFLEPLPASVESDQFETSMSALTETPCR